MSNEILPRLPGQTLKQGRASRWKTDLRETGSGRNFARARWTTGKRDLRLEYEFLRSGGEAELQQLEGFFNRHKGNADTWLFDDENDRSVAHEPFGLGNGVSSAFQLVRARGGFVEPVYELNGAPKLFYAGSAAGVNLLTNSGFEVDSNADGVADGFTTPSSGISGVVTATIETDSGHVYSQAKSQKLVATSTTGSSVIYAYQLVNVDPSNVGKTFSISARMQGLASESTEFEVYIGWRNPGLVLLGSDSGVLAVSDNNWKWPAINSVMPAGATIAEIYLGVRATTAGPMTVWIDEAQFWQGPSPTDWWASVHNWSLGANGVITWASPPEPGISVTWTGDFYWRCRFKRSDMEVEQFMYELWSMRQLEFTTEKP